MKSLASILAFAVMASPAMAQHAQMPGHDHSGARDQAPAAEGQTALSRNADIEKALAGGGEPIVVDVLGVVCDFCAMAMNKTFGRRQEVAAVYVDLDAKTLNLVVKSGAQLTDEKIGDLVVKSGYKLTQIRRGADALGAG